MKEQHEKTKSGRIGRPSIGMMNKSHLTIKLREGDETLDSFKAQVDVVTENSQSTISQVVRELLVWSANNGVFDVLFGDLVKANLKKKDEKGQSITTLAKDMLVQKSKKVH